MNILCILLSLHSLFVITGPYIDVLYNTITNTWNSNFPKDDVPLYGKEFKKMRLNGHFIVPGDDVAICHGENDPIDSYVLIE